MKIRISLTLILIILFSLPAMAIDLETTPVEMATQSLRGTATSMLKSETAPEIDDTDFDIGFEDDESIYDVNYKSPKKAFLYSLLIPGVGQKYAQSSTIKTLAFLGIEAGMWLGYFKYRKDGNQATDAYELFANDHWVTGPGAESGHSYYDWVDVKIETGDTDEVSKFTEDLPERKNQQYYEMIGKYDQFRAGWDDYWLDSATYEERDGEDCDTCPLLNMSPNRITYNNMRADANDLLTKANRFIIFSVVNHLISAFDAALSANRYNRRKADEMWTLSFSAEMKKYSAKEEIPIIKATLRF